jgi:hypothetical protein
MVAEHGGVVASCMAQPTEHSGCGLTSMTIRCPWFSYPILAVRDPLLLGLLPSEHSTSSMQFPNIDAFLSH